MKTNTASRVTALPRAFCTLLLCGAAVALCAMPETARATLRNYPNTTVQLGANTSVTPDAAPINTASINVSTSTNFKGRLEGNPITGVVRVTDAHPAGTYTVTVTAFDGGPTTKTFTLTVTTPATCNPVSFAAATFAINFKPFSVAVGDFNGDGKQDLATANSGSNDVSVLLGDGAGGFGAATNFAAGTSPVSVAVGDFNGDGKQDLAVANFNSNNVSVLLADGAGGFSAAVNFNTGTGPQSMAVGDFNGDGKQDLAVGNPGFPSNVSILLGDGAGGFGAATNFAVGGADSVAVGDFNGDGKQDLAVTNGPLDSVSILLGDGAGGFGAAINFAAGTNPNSVAVGDFNGDGKQDLAVVDSGTAGNVSILLGDGAGGFSAANNFAVGNQAKAVAIGDFNGDGKQDLAVANFNSSNVSILLGDGTGGFGAATNFNAGLTPQSIIVGDFNGDGKQDLATANRDLNYVAVLLRQCSLPPPTINSPLVETGTVGQRLVYQFETSGATSLTVTSLSPGLTFNPTLAAIIGTPTAAGTFQVGLSASNAGGTTNATLTLTVQTPPSSGPVIGSGTSATGRTGQPFKFQVFTTGGSASERVSANGLPAGLSLDAMTGLISGSAVSDGSYAVTLTVTDGNLTTSSILQLTFTSDPAIPVIVSSSSATIIPGQAFNYTINAPCSAGPSDPTVFTLIGTLPPGLTFDAQTGTISGTFTGLPNPEDDLPDRINLSGGIVTNVQLFATNSNGTSTLPLIFFLAPTGAVNISTRIAVGTDDNVLIGGFIITGNAPKRVIIRAIGPSLSPGVPGALQDTMLELHDGSGAILGTNDDWRDSQENEIIDTTVAPRDNREAAILATLSPGNYTAIVAGKSNTTGIAVVEVYDLGTASLDNSSKAQLAQISTRGKVLTDDNVMIGGFIISGSATKVIVRAIGPSLNGMVPGALQDTVLELHDGSGSLIFSNDDWRTDQEQQIIDTTVPPKDNRESAIVATLNPGNYTGIVRGKGNTTGVALVEVYGLQ